MNDATGKLPQDVESRNAGQQLILSVSAAKVAKKQTADKFNDQVGYQAIAIDRISNALPKKLHFFVKGKLKIDQVEIDNVLLGQGKSGLLSNNWWFGAVVIHVILGLIFHDIWVTKQYKSRNYGI